MGHPNQIYMIFKIMRLYDLPIYSYQFIRWLDFIFNKETFGQLELQGHVCPRGESNTRFLQDCIQNFDVGLFGYYSFRKNLSPINAKRIRC